MALLLIPLLIVVDGVVCRRFIAYLATNESDRLKAVNCGPTLIMAQGISTHGPLETFFNYLQRSIDVQKNN
ncbi:MAG: hypothetical protein DRR08_28955 [Candidatus Parabeggiatoa sp. nov. 2]|nr:MAG: hypothetical protein DRR08_28955 [Gammaproteobacteria bacterium]